MKATQQFAVDAKAGGYPTHLILSTIDSELIADEKLLLEPQAWQAVGRTRGWEEDEYDWHLPPLAERKCLQFIGLIFDGLSIEEALTKIV